MKLIYKILLSIFFCSCSSIAQTTLYGQSDINSSNASEYANIYANFKKLYIAKLDSESHYKFAQAGNDFLKKMNHPEQLSGLMKIREHLKWIEENLDKTSFEDLESAKAEWQELQKLYFKERKQNREFHELQSKLLKEEWGINLLAKVQEELILEFPEKFNQVENRIKK